MSSTHLDSFLAHLQAYNSKTDSFNPWAEADRVYDCGPEASKIRFNQLRAYLSPRIERAKYIFVAEAVGYQGAKFSGVPLTSERILLGWDPKIAVSAILPELGALRTSLPGKAPSRAAQEKGYAEPTATIVWHSLLELHLDPLDLIFWNIFPFHPFRPDRGKLSNRTPRKRELIVGRKYLAGLRNLCPPAVRLIAIGEKAAAALGSTCPKIRHPAQGGASLFRKQLPSLIS